MDGRILEAIKNDNIELLKKLINEGHDPKLPCESYERNALLVASKLESLKCLNYLLESNLVPIESTDSFGNTAMSAAAATGKLQSILLLKSFNANLEHRNKKNQSVAQIALYAEKANVIDFFINSKIDLQYMEDELSKLDLNQLRSIQKTEEQNKSNTEIKPQNILPNSDSQISSLTEEDLSKFPGFNEEEILKIKDLINLGFENITSDVKENGSPIGRHIESTKIVELLNKTNNVIMVGDDGVGKTTMAREIANNLIEQDKIVLQVPPALLRGNKYAGSVNENIQKWLHIATAIYPKVILFVDEIHNLTTGKTSNDSADTPTQILKEYLDNVGENRIQILGATSPKEYDKLKESSESFLAKFVNGNNGGFEIKDLNKEQILSILMNERTIEILKKEGLKIDDIEKYKEFSHYSIDLLDKHIFNQKFPHKAFDFLKTLLSFNDLQDLSKEKVNLEFSKKYNVPIELINGYIEQDSVYLDIQKKMQENLLGQDEVLEIISKSIIKDVAFKSHNSRTPLSFLSLGPTGVGKSESVEILESTLKIPKIEFKMGEFKHPTDVSRIVEQLSEFISKNYNGIIVFDEIEKSHPGVLDVLLGLLDKGRIGSGKNEVRCGNQIFIATSNIGADLTSKTKKELREEFGTTGLPEDFLRDVLIDYGMRPEIVNRFSKILDFNPIYLDVALEIGKKMFAKSQKDILVEKGINIVIEDSFVKSQIEQNFDEENNRKNGARGIKRIVDRALEKILGEKEVLLRARPGTTIIVSETTDNEIVLHIENNNGEKYIHTIKESAVSKEDKLKIVMEKIKKNISEAEKLLERSTSRIPS